MAQGTASIVSTRAVVQAAGRRNVDPEDLLRPWGLPLELLDDPDARLPTGTVAELWRRAAVAAREPELPVFAAIELPWRAFRVVDYLVASADTVGEGFGLLARYFRVINDTVRVGFAQDGDDVVFRLVRIDGGELSAAYMDFALAACLFRMTYISDGPVHADVRLRRPTPADPSGHLAAFGPRLRFGADVDEARIPADLWRRPTHTADPVLRDLLEEHARTLVERLSRPSDPLDDLRDAALAAMRAGRTEIGWVADRLGTSVRTLQRRLASSGTHWRELLEELRREAACEYLRNPALSVDDVAVLLGYAEASTFHRAFRRWTGQSPGAWRRGPP